MSETTAAHPQLTAEQTHHDRVRAAMDAMRRATTGVANYVEADTIEGKQNRFADDAGPDHHLAASIARYRDRRMTDLADSGTALFFGRLWLDDGEDYHLGRRHVRDEDDRSVPLVIDWRAPVSEKYYRASAHERRGVTRRRRFGFRGGTLTGFEDENLTLPGAGDPSPDLLAEEIERPRTGPMRDIVATIQPEQDELIRRGLDTSLCVQGAPGTGKTAVGLHRAAWLLYTFPGRFRSGGMLVVGPNDGFLRYIEQVLPALGEASVKQVTVGALTGADDAGAADPHEVAMIKHDARMARVCERAVWGHVGRLDAGAEVVVGGSRFTLPPAAVNQAVERSRKGSTTWDVGRKAVEKTLLESLVREHERRTFGNTPDTRWRTRVKQSPEFKAALDAVWPRLTAKGLLRRLYTDEGFRAEVCAGILEPSEAALLARKSTKPTAADLLLTEELDAHLRAKSSGTTYRHVVVDEAQDLSAMQCRAVARRFPTGSVTVLGDLAQGTTPWAAANWDAQMDHLGVTGAEHTELTTGYRVPGVIIDVANRVLPALGVAVSPARSIRRDGTVDDVGCDDLAAGTAKAVEQALRGEGLVGVIGTADDLAAVRPVLPDTDRVELVPADLAKGLEYDHVVVVEPANVVAAPATGGSAVDGVGLRHLYVAVTRAVSHLTLVHAQPLPEQLG